MKKCIYCGANVEDDSVIDFCERCGVNVFGRKMFETILQRMNDAREEGDLI
jgi:predicted  nucleic acid-binding Zn-ribbon protein